MGCVFCDIGKGKIPARVVFENKLMIAIEDIDPKAKVHFLIFPKDHIAESVHNERSQDIIAEVFKVARKLARLKNLERTGYRVLTNHESDAGQTVPHLHFHLMGGEKLKQI